MSSQQDIYRNTIMHMKKAVRREDKGRPPSPSDQGVKNFIGETNTKKRRLESGYEPRLTLADDRRIGKRQIQFNEFTRNIIHPKPHRTDWDGDYVDSEFEELGGSDLDVSAADEDPYRQVKIENILMPLTSAAELPQHPSLSVPYTSKALDEMVRNAEEMLHRERSMLYRLKRLLGDFQGDDNWTPCGIFHTDQDATLLSQGPTAPSVPPSTTFGDDVQRATDAGWETRLMKGIEDAAKQHDGLDDTMASIPTDTMNGAMPAQIETKHTSPSSTTVLDMPATAANGAPNADPASVDVVQSTATFDHAIKGASDPASSLPPTNGVPTDPTLVNGIISHAEDRETVNPDAADDPDATMLDHDDDGDEDDTAAPAPHRMTTRAKAQALDEGPTRGSSPDTAPSVHPFFAVPTHALPDRTAGLPVEGATEMRRLLSSYVQKQEEVCRGVDRLYKGLMRARRMRDTVFEWCTAEAHVGEMSDGEDWYDKEKWKLEEELKKGEEEVEEGEPGVTTKKTTRNRRAAAAA